MRLVPAYMPVAYGCDRYTGPAAYKLHIRGGNFFMLENSQVDYILIWGHGLVYKDNIIDVIEAQANLKILKILFYKPRKISDLVKTICSYDYAPFRHLKGKTRYLKSTPNKTLFIFVDNIKPDNDYLGEGKFRHLESMTFKALKEEIRNAYNPRCNSKRTEEHVIHISDHCCPVNFHSNVN